MWCVNGTRSQVRQILRTEAPVPRRAVLRQQIPSVLRKAPPAWILWGICPTVFTNTTGKRVLWLEDEFTENSVSATGLSMCSATSFRLYGMRTFCELVRLGESAVSSAQLLHGRLAGANHQRAIHEQVLLANTRVGRLCSQTSVRHKGLGLLNAARVAFIFVVWSLSFCISIFMKLKSFCVSRIQPGNQRYRMCLMHLRWTPWTWHCFWKC